MPGSQIALSINIVSSTRYGRRYLREARVSSWDAIPQHFLTTKISRILSESQNREGSRLATPCLGGPHREEHNSAPVMHGPEPSDTNIVPKTPANNVPGGAWVPQLDFLTNPCSSAAVVQSGVSMRRHNTPPRKLAGMPASSQCLTSPVTGCTKTDPPSPGPGSGTLGTQPEESVATRASKSRKTTVMSLPAERDPGLSVFMLRLLSGQANRFPVPLEKFLRISASVCFHEYACLIYLCR